MTILALALPVGLGWSLVASIILLAVYVIASRAKTGSATSVYFVVGLVCLFTGVFFALFNFWNWLLFLCLTWIAAYFRWNLKWTIVTGLGFTIGLYVFQAIIFIPTYQERFALRLEFPQESLVERLAYESPTSNPSRPAQLEEQSRADYPNEFVTEIEHQLYKSQSEATRRRQGALPALYEAHQGFVHEFISANGFGVGRGQSMNSWRRSLLKQEYLEIPEISSIPIPKPVWKSPIPANDIVDIVDRSEEFSLLQIDENALPNFHKQSFIDFANQRGFGHVESSWKNGQRVKHLDRVTGFQPHAFRTMPDPPTNADNSVRWLIDKLELVSLLKFDTPRVYESENLPRMDELRDAPTRALDEFETGALAKLRGGEELVLNQERNEIRMLGPILAVNQCLECHSVERGALLGAFSYKLIRDPQLPQANEKSVMLQ